MVSSFIVYVIAWKTIKIHQQLDMIERIYPQAHVCGYAVCDFGLDKFGNRID